MFTVMVLVFFQLSVLVSMVEGVTRWANQLMLNAKSAIVSQVGTSNASPRSAIQYFDTLYWTFNPFKSSLVKEIEFDTR